MFLFVLFIFIDQISKYLVRHWGGFYICNKGIAFGITIPYFSQWIIILFLLFFIFWQILNLKFRISNETLNSLILKIKNYNLIQNSKFKIQNYGILLILAGAVSNILDRLYFGCVIDFIKIPFWPLFNLADAFIVIGVIITVWSIYKHK